MGFHPISCLHLHRQQQTFPPQYFWWSLSSHASLFSSTYASLALSKIPFPLACSLPFPLVRSSERLPIVDDYHFGSLFFPTTFRCVLCVGCLTSPFSFATKHVLDPLSPAGFAIANFRSYFTPQCTHTCMTNISTSHQEMQYSFKRHRSSATS